MQMRAGSKKGEGGAKGISSSAGIGMKVELRRV